ncbi:MAG: putative addiction module antidote protein [Alphaproteobacteria bacterium]|nr:putative addiction module antidote protein [Alphaproteobacteria bacterium]
MAKAKIKTLAWDPAATLRDDADIAAYLDAVLAENDPALLAHALGVAARAKGMGDIAKRAGVGRESLYKSLSRDGNPSFATVQKVLQALGVRLRAA